MNNYKKLVFGILILIFSISNLLIAQSDSLLYKELDLKKIGVNYYNFSKQDKFNFEVIVLGGVRSPGIYLLPEGTTLIEIVALTGGSIDESIYDNFKLIRSKSKNPELKADTIMIISYKDFFDKEKVGSLSKQNPILKPGDIVSFPIKPDKEFWDTASKVATIFVIPLISVATLIITIMSYNK